MIEKNKVVSLLYQLRIDSYDGEIIEEVKEEEPLVFLFGNGNMLDKFEDNIKGLKENEEFMFTIPCQEAYGEATEEAIVDFPVSTFEVDGKIDRELLAEGNLVPMEDEEGNEFEGVVVNLDDDTVTLDFNHPFAGDDLYFSGKIIAVQYASKKEIEQGFADEEIID